MSADTTTAKPLKRRHRVNGIAVDGSRSYWSREVVRGILSGIVAIAASGLVAATFDWLDGWTGVLAGSTVAAGIIWIAVQIARHRNRRTGTQIARGGC